jgi:hypothetical protein
MADEDFDEQVDEDELQEQERLTGAEAALLESPFSVFPITLIGGDNVAGQSYLAYDVHPQLTDDEVALLVRISVRGYLRRGGEDTGSLTEGVATLIEWVKEEAERLLRR